jgi:hypothetical protein
MSPGNWSSRCAEPLHETPAPCGHRMRDRAVLTTGQVHEFPLPTRSPPHPDNGKDAEPYLRPAIAL